MSVQCYVLIEGAETRHYVGPIEVGALYRWYAEEGFARVGVRYERTPRGAVVASSTFIPPPPGARVYHPDVWPLSVRTEGR